MNGVEILIGPYSFRFYHIHITALFVKRAHGGGTSINVMTLLIK